MIPQGLAPRWIKGTIFQSTPEMHWGVFPSVKDGKLMVIFRVLSSPMTYSKDLPKGWVIA